MQPATDPMASYLAPLTAWTDQYLTRKARIDGDHTVLRLRGVLAANDLALNQDDHDGVNGARVLFAYLLSPYAEAARSARAALLTREGRISQPEYQRALRELHRDYRMAAMEAADDAYEAELDRW